ncbi:MAG: hypothetical protein N3D11_16530, partial [Candidatus Sumerlaeia bacterium]|nr:hypothetical protein [Candidatus Sumerlaeia bacterium]
MRAKKPIRGQFVPISVELLRSRVWQLLPVTARALWPEIVWQARRQTQGDTTQPFTFPQRHLNYTQNTVAKAIRALCDLGLIVVHRQGGLLAVPSQYQLTDDWRTWSPAKADPRRRVFWQQKLEDLLVRERRFAESAADVKRRRNEALRASAGRQSSTSKIDINRRKICVCDEPSDSKFASVTGEKQQHSDAKNESLFKALPRGCG